MNQKEIDLRMAAAGYPKLQKKRRKPRIKFNLENPDVIHRMKLMHLQKVLDSVGWHQAKAARMLGIHRVTLWRWLQELKN